MRSKEQEVTNCHFLLELPLTFSLDSSGGAGETSLPTHLICLKGCWFWLFKSASAWPSYWQHHLRLFYTYSTSTQLCFDMAGLYHSPSHLLDPVIIPGSHPAVDSEEPDLELILYTVLFETTKRSAMSFTASPASRCSAIFLRTSSIYIFLGVVSSYSWPRPCELKHRYHATFVT